MTTAYARSHYIALALVFPKSRRSMSVHWVACGTYYTKTEGNELGGVELQSCS